MKIVLNRTYADDATIGELFINGELHCYTVERPWLDNQFRISCIPEGTYPIELKQYGRWHEKWKSKDWYKGVLILRNTSPRSEILIHTANYSDQLNGCIAPGLEKGHEGDGTPCVWKSNQALRYIYPTIADAILNDENVTIEIK